MTFGEYLVKDQGRRGLVCLIICLIVSPICAILVSNFLSLTGGYRIIMSIFIGGTFGWHTATIGRAWNRKAKENKNKI